MRLVARRIAIAAFVLAACGGSGDTDPGATEAATAMGDGELTGLPATDDGSDTIATGPLDDSTSAPPPGVCGEDPVPPGGPACPPACTGGCADGVCTITCMGVGVCDTETITCPPDHACLLVCDGGDACDTSTLECADGYACEVQCVDGTDACGDLEVHCNDASTCTVSCSETPVVCTGMVVTCGSGECTATCAGGSTPDLECGDACMCTPC